MLHIFRNTLRLLAKDRWFSAVAILVLSAGIGVNATAFAVVNAALFRSPFEEAERLYVVTWRARAGGRVNASYGELQDWRAQIRSFESLAAFSSATMNVSDTLTLPEQVRGAWVTANTFGLLKRQPLLGRDFTADDDAPGAARVVIISHAIWQNRYGGDAKVIGRAMRLNGYPATIVGVMPPDVRFPSNTDLWAAFVPTEAQLERNARVLTVFGRLRRDANPRRAQLEVTDIARRFADEYPDTNRNLVGARVETFTERFVGGNGRRVFVAMMGAVCFILLITCANLAVLLLSRSAARAREISVRMALGATRARVIAELLLESTLLSVMGGAIGLLFAIAGSRAVEAAVQDPDRPYWIVFSVDYVVVGYIAAVCVFTGVVFGLAPILHVSKRNLHDILRESGRSTGSSPRVRWFSAAMVVTELALTVVLLAGAGLMIRSFFNVYTLDIGVRTDDLMAMRMPLPVEKYETPDARRAFYDRLEPRLAAIPGLDKVAVTTSVPPLESPDRFFEVDGKSRASTSDLPEAAVVAISPEYFELLQVALVRGRNFQALDGATLGSETAIIDERLAAEFFPGEDPIGQRLRFVQRDGPPGQLPSAWRTVVGVSPSIRHASSQDESGAVLYIPYNDEPSPDPWLLIRSQLPPDTVMQAVRREVQAIDRDQPVFAIQTVEQLLAQSRWPYRVFGSLFTIFAALAIALASIALYAVIAYSVTQRTKEIGLRMALGAQRWQIAWMIVKRALVQLGIGLTLGLAASSLLTGVLRRVLVRITPTDPLTFLAISIVLAVVSLAACLIPVLRATRVDPLVALRVE